MWRFGTGGVFLAALFVVGCSRHAEPPTEELAERGNREAQAEMGHIFEKGLFGRKQDIKQAIAWYRRAATNVFYTVKSGDAARRIAVYQGVFTYNLLRANLEVDFRNLEPGMKVVIPGHPGAQFNLGVLHERGKGVPKSDKKAAEWYLKAARQEHPESQFSLAVMYEKGQGVGKDLSEAAKWYQRAAELGFAAAQQNLGHMFLTGKGVNQDLVMAYKWTALAVKKIEENKLPELHMEFRENRDEATWVAAKKKAGGGGDGVKEAYIQLRLDAMTKDEAARKGRDEIAKSILDVTDQGTTAAEKEAAKLKAQADFARAKRLVADFQPRELK